MTITSATGKEGMMIYSHLTGEYFFRIYDIDGEFTDYKIYHGDLCVTRTDTDAFFYKDLEGRNILDYSPETLGINRNEG